jgi:ADP-ribose pyrophosphatase
MTENLAKTSRLAPWSCLDEKIFLDFPYLQIVERLCKKSEPTGEDHPPHRYYVVKSRDWCNIIPITEEGKIVLVKQFRAGTLDYPYEFPGGILDSSDEDFEKAALRELLEETGYGPTAGTQVRHLGSSRPNPALQDNQAHSFFVSPVKKISKQNLDPGEDLIVEEKTFAEFFELLKDGKFPHALMLTSLFFLLQAHFGPDEIQKALGAK